MTLRNVRGYQSTRYKTSQDTCEWTLSRIPYYGTCVYKVEYILQLLLPIDRTNVLKLPLLFGHKVELSSCFFFWQSYRSMFRLILPASISWQLKLIVNTTHTRTHAPILTTIEAQFDRERQLLELNVHRLTGWKI